MLGDRTEQHDIAMHVLIGLVLSAWQLVVVVVMMMMLMLMLILMMMA